MTGMDGKKIVIVPAGWPVTLAACPPGAFVWDGQLCFKSEYSQGGKVEAFNRAGEYLCIDLGTFVTPVIDELQDAEE